MKKTGNEISPPDVLNIDPCTHCQLRCPGCPNTDLGHPPGMGWGWLRFDRFKDLIETTPHFGHVRLDCFGEAFLNPDLYRILEYGSGKGLSFSFSSANFNHVRPEVLEALVQFNVQSLSVAFDGASEETYAIYRKRGDLQLVLSNIRRLNELKSQYGADTPVLEWLWVVFGHNEHEIAKAKEMARELNMEFKPKLQWNSSFSPIRDAAAVRRELGWNYTTREEYHEVNSNHYMRKVCHQLWTSPRINWDGRVLGCCWTQIGFGANVFEDGYENAINCDKISYAREMLMGLRDPRADIPCTNCKLYRVLAEGNSFLTLEEIHGQP